MKTIILFILLAINFASSSMVFATISELHITKGASFVDASTTTPIAYAGIAGSDQDCDSESIANNTVCNNCTDTVQPCNEQRIYPELLLRVEFKTDKDYTATAGAKIRFQAGTDGVVFDAKESSTSLPANTVLYALVLWSDLCSSLGNTNCAADSSSLQTVKVGIEVSGTMEESANFQLQIVGNSTVAPTYTYHSNCGTGEAIASNEGFCYFKLHTGDAKAFIQDETAPDSYNRTVNGVTFKTVRFYYEPGDINCAVANFSAVTPLSPYYDLTTTNDGATYYLDDNKLSDLENGTRYYFRMANTDIAGNIYYFSSAVGDPLVTSGAATAFLTCEEHSIIPEEVIGLLDDGKSDFACFIATAAYGSTMATELGILRSFRDQFLKTNFFGRSFVKWYYAWSPKYANWLRKKSFFRSIVRGALVPVVMFAKFSLWGGIGGIVLFMSGGLAFCIYGLRRFKKRA